MFATGSRTLLRSIHVPGVVRIVQTSAKMGSAAVEKEPKSTHYNDWPNALGFDSSFEERTPVELRVEGQIPSYAAGVLFRTGMGPRTIETNSHKTFRVNHWFDNFGEVHRFQIHAPKSSNDRVRVTYNSRLVTDGLIEKVKKTGRLDKFTFAAKYDPCKSFFQKLQSIFISPPPPKPNEENICVTISVNLPGLTADGKPAEGGHSKGQIVSLVNKTDAPVFQTIDPNTLEPIGLANQEVLHPSLKGASSGAHAKSDPVTGDVYNFNLDFGRTGTYRVFRTSASTGKTSILATFSSEAAYLHSIFLTENYVIVCVWNSHYKAGGAAILWTKNLLDAMTYADKTPAKWYVIDKRAPEEGGKEVVATYTSSPFFAFHTVNAWEEKTSEGKTDIVADIPAYPNLEVLQKLFLDNLISDSADAKAYMGKWGNQWAPTLRRYRLPDVPISTKSSSPSSSRRTSASSSELARGEAIIEFDCDRNLSPELPIMNFSYFTHKHRYVYGISDSGKSTFADSLVKYDVDTHTVKRWSIHGHTAGEAIFVADPASDQEDGGVLLSVVLDGVAGKSYLLVLDARDMTEIGRAHVDGAIGFGFHGVHTKVGLPSADVGGKVAMPEHY